MTRSLRNVFKSPFVYTDGSAVEINNSIRGADAQPQGPTEEELREEEERRAREEEEARFEARVREEVGIRVEEIRRGMEAEQNNAMFKANSIADKLRADAQNDADLVLAKANVRAHDIREAARREGYAEGFREGKKESLDECDGYVSTAAQFLSEVNKHKELYYAAQEEDLVKLVIEMAQKVVMNELKTDPRAIFHMAQQAAKKFRNADYLKVSMAKGEVSEQFLSDKKLIQSICASIPEIELEILSEAEPGTLILDNGHEILDASVPTQLDLLQEILENGRKKAEPPPVAQEEDPPEADGEFANIRYEKE